MYIYFHANCGQAKHLWEKKNVVDWLQRRTSRRIWTVWRGEEAGSKIFFYWEKNFEVIINSAYQITEVQITVNL